MGLADTIGRDDRTEIKTETLFELMKEGARSELVMNAVNCNVPHRYIREMSTGKSEATGQKMDANRVGVPLAHV